LVAPVYVVTDVEVDGPVPGENSMLSFASVAVDHAGRPLDDFEANLSPLDNARSDPDTMAWFASHPEVLDWATSDPRAPSDAVEGFVAWVRRLPGEPVFVAHPLLMDAPWIDHYLRRFAGIRLHRGPWQGERLFHGGGLCLRSFVSGRLGVPLADCDPATYPAEWLGHVRHTHRAIDDASGYAYLLCYAMARTLP
jgi:hypothetical protein